MYKKKARKSASTRSHRVRSCRCARRCVCKVRRKASRR